MFACSTENSNSSSMSKRVSLKHIKNNKKHLVASFCLFTSIGIFINKPFRSKRTATRYILVAIFTAVFYFIRESNNKSENNSTNLLFLRPQYDEREISKSDEQSSDAEYNDGPLHDQRSALETYLNSHEMLGLEANLSHLSVPSILLSSNKVIPEKSSNPDQNSSSDQKSDKSSEKYPNHEQNPFAPEKRAQCPSDEINVEINPSCDLPFTTFQGNHNFTDDPHPRLLLPILKWGPNNQVSGFYEAMHLAKALDRTLVVPPFYFHESDKCRNHKKDHVPAELRLNTDNIANMMTLDQYKQICGDQPVAALLTTDVTKTGLHLRLVEFEHIANMSILAHKRKQIFKTGITTFPSDPRTIQDDQLRTNWRMSYRGASNFTCAMFVLPFRTIVNPPHHYQSWKNRKAYDFAEIILRMTEGFMKDFPDITVGAHWRWNNGDWSHRCTRTDIRPPECTIMPKLDLSKVAKNLEDAANQRGVGNVYKKI